MSVTPLGASFRFDPDRDMVAFGIDERRIDEWPITSIASIALSRWLNGTRSETQRVVVMGLMAVLLAEEIHISHEPLYKLRFRALG